METNPEAELKRGYRQAAIIGIAMVFGVLVYGVIVEMMRMSPGFLRQPLHRQEADSIKYLLLGLALIEFLLIRMIRDQLLSRKSNQTTKLQKGSFSSMVMKLLTTSIITYAFCESVALFVSLVLFFSSLQRDPLNFISSW